MTSPEVKKILEKYKRKIEKEVNSDVFSPSQTEEVSREYGQFKKEMMPELSRYEKWCQSLGNIIKIRPSKKDEKKVKKFIETSHLNVTPSQVLTLSVLSLLLSFFIGVLISVSVFLIQGAELSNFPFLFLFLILIFSLFIFYYTYNLPKKYALKWRLKASSQMVPAILYVVIYMRHNSNLERAIAFASKHLNPPLAYDFKKIFWDVETGKFSTIKDSLDAYLETWRDYSIEFIESFHLIESSLYEPSDSRRITVLDKALQVILDGVYDKMLKYTHDVRSPLFNLYMLGIVLPTLGLALIPLASALVQIIKWYHVLILFNLIIPFFVFYLTNEIISKRPGGYGETGIIEKNPLYYQFKSKRPYLIAFLVVLPILLIGFFPLYYQYLGIEDFSLTQAKLGFLGESMFFDYKETVEGIAGPYGLGALLLGLFVPLGAGLFFIIAFKMKTKELIKSRDYTKQLEKEFASSIFQLGNRLADGIPAEIAFGKVAKSSKGMVTENFFRIVNANMRQSGMSLEQAIFNKRRGALIYYPSGLILTSMRILLEAVKKGLKVAANALMSISDYVKNINKINDRLRDLLAEIRSDMRSNMTFLAPLLAGVVVGLSGMITLILNTLSKLNQADIAQEVGNLGTIMAIFDVTKMIPPYYLQIAVGLYIIEIIFILTTTLVAVDAGEDKLKKVHDIGKVLKRGVLLYLITAFIAIVALAFLGAMALGGIG